MKYRKLKPGLKGRTWVTVTIFKILSVLTNKVLNIIRSKILINNATQ